MRFMPMPLQQGFWVLLRLRVQPREDTGLSLAEAVFGTPIVLPNMFLHGEEFSIDNI
jgi:hypothetical protein